jgi:hypothetical protein
MIQCMRILLLDGDVLGFGTDQRKIEGAAR